jgi:2-iminobutanoate/2-iminopropanoate deaminase
VSASDAEQIKTSPDAFEPYFISQGFRVGDLVFLSGQAAIDDQGAVVGVGDFDAQAAQVFRNIEAVLQAAGTSLSRVFKVVIYLTDMANFPKILELRQTWFTQPYPADTVVEVRSLAFPELLIEVDAIAVVDGQLTAAKEDRRAPLSPHDA